MIDALLILSLLGIAFFIGIVVGYIVGSIRAYRHAQNLMDEYHSIEAGRKSGLMERYTVSRN